MSLWSAFSVGVGGLQTSSNALNTVSHNLTNVDTEGFTRQQVQQSDRPYITISKTESAISYQQTGLGVYYSNAKQVRDYFLDKTYRREVGRNEFYDVSASTLHEVEDLLGELNGDAFQTSISDLWTAVQELTKDPCNSVTQGALVSQAEKFLTDAQAVYDGLSGYQDNLNAQVKQQVEKINKIGKEILDLNDKIRLIELSGESANDLRDTRNLYLDQLAELCSISYKEDSYGNLSVQIEGEDFVKGSLCYEIGLQMDNTTGFYTPFWPQNAEYTIGPDGEKVYDISNAKVFDLGRTISSELATDIGGLKAMLLARGDHRADYTDIENGYDDVSQSVLMNIQAEFDQLVHNLVSAVNGVLADATGVKPVDSTDTTGLYAALQANDPSWYEGKVYQVVKADEADYMIDNDGSPLQLFKKSTTEGYLKQDLTVGGITESYWVYAEEQADVKESLYGTMNSSVNPSLKQTPTLLGFRLKDGSEDTVTMDKLKAVFTDQKYTLNPYVLKHVNLTDYYGDLVSQIANSAYVFQSIYDNQATTVEAAQTARDQVTAVSSDEELSNMIRFQSAYNASSRFINVVDSMLEHLLMRLG
ncbi:MAG: flagellar hook-associated protein FlgK [Lachnospiraceae bacterium]|nr:flagellar hook-associated protein FlgK [Lachnospiraceae bacterium]